MNVLIIQGNAGAEAKIGDGDKWAKISVAVDASYKNGDDWVDATDWFTVFFQGYNVDKAKKIQKGDRLLIEGRVKPKVKEIGDEKVTTFSVAGWKFTNFGKYVKEEEAASSGSEKSSKSVDEDDLPF